MPKSPILGGFSTQRSPNAADNLAINLGVEIIETQDGKVHGYLFGMSGLDLLLGLPPYGLSGGSITAGTGYAIGDTINLTPVGGTFSVAPVIQVASVSGGGVTGFTIIQAGNFTVEATSFTQASTTGSGTGFALGSPGWFTIGPVRGLAVLNGVLYATSNNLVYSISETGVITLCGPISLGAGPVSMFQNINQLMIVDGVGGWIVPGGYPLTGGTIAGLTIGGLYAVGDTVVLRATSGFQSAYPTITITAIANNPVVDFAVQNPGTGYTSASGVSTTPIQPQPGHGSGLKLNITASGGQVTAASPNVAGTGYSVGDTGTMAGGTGGATYQVVTESGGAVTTVRILNGGVGYSSTTNVATAAGPGITPNSGVGFTVNTTASGGAITSATIASAGTGFAEGAAGTISGGGGDATYLILDVGLNGAVTGFTITAPGAIADEASAFIQKSTSGSGSGFELSSPTYGAYLGLVPITLPFANPVKGVVSDGFGIMVFQGSQNIASSDELDLSTWQALNYGVADQSPDSCVGCDVLHDQVYIQKEKNTEVWVDEGLANFAFGPLQGVHIEYGIAAAFSSAKIDNSLIWLSRNDQGQGVFVELSAYVPKIISTQALTAVIQKYANIGDCIAYARQEGLHSFYVATFPEANETWVYDKTSSELAGFPVWTQLAALDNGMLNRHWGNCFSTWGGSSFAVNDTTNYQPVSVMFTTAILSTAADLVGLPASFNTGLFSVWLDISDTTGLTGMVFGATPGLQIEIQNDQTGSPQITVEAWDASANPIVVATYDFSGWAAWVNVMISIDTATNQLQVYANTITASVFTETLLTASSITWSSTNPIAPSLGQPWQLTVVP